MSSISKQQEQTQANPGVAQQSAINQQQQDNFQRMVQWLISQQEAKAHNVWQPLPPQATSIQQEGPFPPPLMFSPTFPPPVFRQPGPSMLSQTMTPMSMSMQGPVGFQPPPQQVMVGPPPLLQARETTIKVKFRLLTLISAKEILYYIFKKREV